MYQEPYLKDNNNQNVDPKDYTDVDLPQINVGEDEFVDAESSLCPQEKK